MNMIRTWYGAGVIAGLAVFLWGGLAHMVLGLGGDSTFKRLPDEALTAVNAQIKEPGLYMFPYTRDPNEMAKLIEKNPYGLMVVTPAGVPMNMGSLLGMQAVSDILASVLAALLLSLALPGLTSLALRAGFVVGLGMFSFLVSEVPYWNWYRFPADFTAYSLLFKLTAWAIAGVILAFLMGRRQAAV